MEVKNIMSQKMEAESILLECGDYFDASESLSDCLARKRLNL